MKKLVAFALIAIVLVVLAGSAMYGVVSLRVSTHRDYMFVYFFRIPDNEIKYVLAIFTEEKEGTFPAGTTLGDLRSTTVFETKSVADTRSGVARKLLRRGLYFVMVDHSKDTGARDDRLIWVDRIWKEVDWADGEYGLKDTAIF